MFTGQRLAHRWIGQCYLSYLRRNIIKDLHCTAQYCISVKDNGTHLTKINVKLEDVHKSDLRRNTNWKKITEVRKQSVKELEESSNRFPSSEKTYKNTLTYKKLERLYPDPKTSLLNIYKLVGDELKNQTIITSNCDHNHTSHLWEYSYNVKWPETVSFKGIGKTKGIACKIAALKCLESLEMSGKLKNGKPVIYSSIQIKDMQFKPSELSVPSEILGEMKNLIEIYNTKIQDIITQESLDTTSCITLPQKLLHPILGEVLYTDECTRNDILKSRLLERRTENKSLPIFDFKNEILSKLQNNRVVLIEGDTGCGKTTQVPQFIMDSFAENGNATDCNILVSQPRRISAISLADRIAYERGEVIGDVVGYQVRLEQTIPADLGGILFCTTGVLLRKLQHNPGLKGCSHVILDEAHERSIDTDMLMILLKRALEQNANLKVLIMSATINAHLFQRYFNCPVVKIPGRLYPVEMNFLDDIEKLPNIHKYRSYNKIQIDDDSEMLLVDYGKIVQIIRWISRYKPHGAILCFLPGWNEITTIQSILENNPLEREEQMILPIHSKVSYDAQRKIFNHVSKDTRKIILATDIAETGITVSDVCYVVDSAIRKESRWDDSKNLLSIRNRWISRANIKQRKGRAGRVKPGVSYHLITKENYEKLEPHPIAQVLCSSLEKVVLDSKTYTSEKAKDFFADMLEPPTPTAIQRAVNYLMDIGVLEQEENLTALGKRMALFPTHPKFSKALVYSSIFNCIHPVVTIASIFSDDDNVFYGLLNNKMEIRNNKRLYHPFSDHIAMSWIFKQWFAHNLESSRLMSMFCKQMMLRHGKMQTTKRIREMYIQQLIQCRMLAKNTGYDNYDVDANKYENNDELVRALLYSATQQLIKHKNIGLKNGVIRTGVNELRTQTQAKAVISGESVNYKRKVWPSPYLTYFHGMHCETRRSTVIRETSMISPIAVLLFNQGKIQYFERENDETEILIHIDPNNRRHILRFSCNKETADVLLKFKDIIWSVVQYWLEKQGIMENSYDNNLKQMTQYKQNLLETLVETLRISSEHIEEDESAKLNT